MERVFQKEVQQVCRKIHHRREKSLNMATCHMRDGSTHNAQDISSIITKCDDGMGAYVTTYFTVGPCAKSGSHKRGYPKEMTALRPAVFYGRTVRQTGVREQQAPFF